MPEHHLPIAVIGGGVIGLTSAIRLLEHGFPTTIFAKVTSPHTTSDVAAAYWAPEPILEGGPRESWALTSLATFRQLAADPSIGIDIMPLYELADSLAIETFAGALENSSLEQVETVTAGVFPSPWSGLSFIVPRIDVPTYMPWLFQRFLTLGGELKRAEIHNLRTLAADFPLIVNCTGLGAQALTGDSVFPIRGQVIRVRKPIDLPPYIISAASTADVTYIVPRRHDCLLGGTFQDYNYDLQVDAATAESILQRCVNFHPALQHAEIIEHRVGLRPGRAQVRLEVEPLTATTTVIHNYGHGAYGHTLSWGCAAEVVTHVKNLQR